MATMAYRSRLACVALLVLLSSSYGVSAEETAGLPQPLTLEHALSLLEVDHPTMQQARSDRQSALARLQESESADDISVSLEARARWVRPLSSSGDEVVDDHKGSLFVRKPLYDFGRTGAMQHAASSEAEAKTIRYQSQRDQRRIEIMRAFFDVLLADQENFRDNEALAIGFITLDRLRNRQELGQSSDIAVLEQESAYQAIRYRMQKSQSRQRMTRSQLANLLNRPGDLPADLVTPDFNLEERKLPEYESLLAVAEQNNPTLKALQLELQAAQQRVESARSGKLPILDAELEASSYSRELGSSDRWRAGITLSVPIYNGDRISAAVAREQAQVLRMQAKLDEARQELRQTLLENWFAIQQLALQREQAMSELSYRELYLDRSRANYEMEVKADLGDAMVRLSDAQLALVRNDFEMALAWEQLAALAGVDMTQLLSVEKQP